MDGGRKRKSALYYDPNSQKFIKKSKYYEMKSSAQPSRVSLSSNVSLFAILFLFVSSPHVRFLAYNSIKSWKDWIMSWLNSCTGVSWYVRQWKKIYKYSRRHRGNDRRKQPVGLRGMFVQWWGCRTRFSGIQFELFSLFQHSRAEQEQACVYIILFIFILIRFKIDERNVRPIMRMPNSIQWYSSNYFLCFNIREPNRPAFTLSHSFLFPSDSRWKQCRWSFSRKQLDRSR